MLLNRKRIDFWAKFVAVGIVLAFAGAGVVQWGSALLFSRQQRAADSASTTNELGTLTQAFAADPGNEEVAVALAGRYDEKGEKAKAKAVYIAALKKKPRSIRLLSALGASYLESRDGSSALNQFMLVIKEDPRSYYGHLGIAYAYEMLGKKELAVATLKSYLSGSRPTAEEKRTVEQELQRLQGAAGK